MYAGVVGDEHGDDDDGAGTGDDRNGNEAYCSNLLMTAAMMMSMSLMTVVMAVLGENYDCGNADGDCDGADEVEDCIADDEDNGDDGVFLMLATYVRMSMTVWCRWWRRCG